MTGFERQWQSRFEKFATRHRAEHLVSGWSAAGLRRRVAVFEGLIEGGLLAAGARAWHYNFDDATARWIDDRDGHDLNERLAEAISERIGRTVEFET